MKLQRIECLTLKWPTGITGHSNFKLIIASCVDVITVELHLYEQNFNSA